MAEGTELKKDVYSVWGIPPEEVGARAKKVMEGLRSEFGGPAFEPHVTVVGAISLTEADALEKFRLACDGLKAYDASVDSVATGSFFYQCVYLLLRPSPEVITLAFLNSQISMLDYGWLHCLGIISWFFNRVPKRRGQLTIS